MKTWIISDTHFFHKNIVKYESRPENFNDIIIENWNKYITDDDLVVHLGDVILGHNSSLDSILSRCKGRKILVRGNHDGHSNSWYLSRGFSFVSDYFVDKNIAFSHAPLTPLPTQTLVKYGNTVDLNIHGHFHRGLHRSINIDWKDRYYDNEYYYKNKNKYHLIQIEDTLSPVLLDNILRKRRLKV